MFREFPDRFEDFNSLSLLTYSRQFLGLSSRESSLLEQQNFSGEAAKPRVHRNAIFALPANFILIDGS